MSDMPLREEISLNKRQLKAFGVFPHFFENALNAFHFLTEEHGFGKPELATWKNEGQVKYSSREFEVIIEYESPDWVDVTFKKSGRSDRVSLRHLTKTLGLPINPSKTGSDNDATMQGSHDDLSRAIQTLSTNLQENSADIFTYLRDTTS